MLFKTIEKLFNTLQEIGLSTNEANTYIGLLSIGTNPVSTIAKKVNLNRGTCYSILENLMRKGFIQEIIKKNITYYTAVEPHYIVEQLKRKQYILREKINYLTNALPEFEYIKSDTSHKPKVTFFEGEEGLQNIMEDTLNALHGIRAYASVPELLNLLPNYFQSYSKRRISKKIFVKAIYPTNPMSIEYKKRDQEELRETHLIPQQFDFHLDILIYNNKVALTSLEAKFGVLIESKEMAQAQGLIFDFIWNSDALKIKV